VDVGGRRLRRSEQRKVSGRVFGAPSGTGPQAATGDLPDQRRLRKPTKLSHSSESNLEDKLGRREFFDIFTWADKYAQLIGRPDVRPHAQQRSLLDGIESHLLLAEKEGDIEDLSTSASDCDGKLESIKESPAVPSLQVRRMLQSLLPARSSLDIPLEMVARLEHLVELADRVESKK
ncbi:afr, partial [Symbiodinium microadriaticum]